MMHVYRYEDGSYLAEHFQQTTDLQQAVVGTKARVAAKAGAVTAHRGWRRLTKLTGKAVPVTITENA